MRVTDAAYSRLFLESIRSMKSNQNDLVQQLASGKKVSRPSDAPGDEHQIAIFKAEISRLAKYSQTTDSLNTTFSQYDSIMNQVSNLLHTSFQKGSAAASSTNQGPTARAALSAELGQIRDQILSLANSSMDGNYIFSGTQTSTQPFTIDTATGVVSYQGNSDAITVEAAPETFLQKNLPGDQVFMGSNGIFNSITSLIDAIDAGDQTGIENSLTSLSGAMDELSTSRSDNGAKMASLDISRTVIQNRTTELVKSASNLEDADIAQVVSDLKLDETGLQSLFSSFTMTNGNSLFNYIA